MFPHLDAYINLRVLADRKTLSSSLVLSKILVSSLSSIFPFQEVGDNMHARFEAILTVFFTHVLTRSGSALQTSSVILGETKSILRIQQRSL